MEQVEGNGRERGTSKELQASAEWYQLLLVCTRKGSLGRKRYNKQNKCQQVK